ncbi:FecR family protein [Leptospira alstonii]|uniref:Sigma factor regulatory protein, FecR/PupR family n=2 Tax=Leptospira alstonii TaxID=28452 RepID=M6D1M1_9LEPT|nr:FecR family protein [Leptospira alstonii]EMJ98032.1 sigma factor regulatory protein, FecR/PupR family [Leptospira alstonii serovar Sichuan str. 79601]EQA80937.1 sigma factor regulatory protein, FecR/PupR family [Leptospira alstonii serovar Pingchang str. 80-412]
MQVRVVSILLLFFLISNSSFSCRFISSLFTKNERVSSGMVVIFQSGDVEITRNEKKLRSTPGLILQENDLVRTSSGSIDIQTANGELIRVRPYAKLTLKSISDDQHGETNLYVQAGELLVKTNKLKTNKSFFISTPTTVAGVRGTTFSFELTKGKSPKVKVYEGSVAIAFKIPKEILEVDKAKDEELYKEFITFLEKNEIVLEDGEASYVKPNIDQMIQLVLTRMENNEDISKEFDTIRKIGNRDLQKTAFVETPQENAEIETLVQADSNLIEKALNEQNPDSTQPTISSISSEIQQDQNSKLDQALHDIQTKAEANGFNNEVKIREYYNVLEIVVKSDGTKLSGAIITQIGDKLILHTPSGVIRLNKNDIDYVDYQSFRIRTKTK